MNGIDGIKGQLIDKAEVVDVEGDFRIENGADCGDDFFFERFLVAGEVVIGDWLGGGSGSEG